MTRNSRAYSDDQSTLSSQNTFGNY